MRLPKHTCFAAVLLCVSACLAFPNRTFGQSNYYAAKGAEFMPAGALAGDQVNPDAAISPSGGFMVWQDNVTDGSGWGISAQRLSSTLSGTLSPFRVNVQGTNDQQFPRVALTKNGGAVFAWQGGAAAHTHIYARILSPTNTWLSTTDLVVSTFTNTFQMAPALAVLNNSNVVVVWSSYNQAGANSQMDIYGKILSPKGAVVSNTFLINQFTSYNQRSPSVTALTGGGFAVAWVSEQENTVAPNLGANTALQKASASVLPSVDVYARIYASNGAPASKEFIVDQTGNNPCSGPALAPDANGGFMVAWSAKDLQNTANGWDIFARPVSSAGVGGSIVAVNSFTYGDQYSPRISSIGSDFMVVWTSLAEDGSREGVFGQLVHDDGTLVGSQFLVNTTTQGQQMQQSIASDGVGWFQVVWTGFNSLATGFDVYAQRYSDPGSVLQPMNAPYVYAPFNVVSNQYIPQLEVVWPSIPGLAIANFQIYVDGSLTPTNVAGTTNMWVMGPADGLANSSTHTFQVGYMTAEGYSAAASPSASGTTWSGQDYFGVPLEWIEHYYSINAQNWPANVNAPLGGSGMSVYDLFLSGGNPTQPATWLTTSMTKTSQGVFINWNCQPGLTYQVQQSTNLTTWNPVGTPRFEAGTNDSLNLGNSPQGNYYRMVLLNQ